MFERIPGVRIETLSTVKPAFVIVFAGRLRRRSPAWQGNGMKPERLEAFSDGVFAVALTVLVLEIKIPVGIDWQALHDQWPTFFSYVLSFIYIGIYWNNHHHLFAAVQRIDGGVMWSNLHLLFWLTLFPFGTGWMDSSHFAAKPTAVYGIILLMAAIAYWIMQSNVLRLEPSSSALRREIGVDLKGKLSPLLYLLGIGLAFIKPWAACGCYMFVAAMWIIPDRRIERAIEGS
jgi:uncharacterized membrane protein